MQRGPAVFHKTLVSSMQSAHLSDGDADFVSPSMHLLKMLLLLWVHRVLLCDFGCARHWETKQVPEKRLGRFNTFAGTPAYMSPQVCVYVHLLEQGLGGMRGHKALSTGFCKDDCTQGCRVCDSKDAGVQLWQTQLLCGWLSAATSMQAPTPTHTRPVHTTPAVTLLPPARFVPRCFSRRSTRQTHTMQSRQTCGLWASYCVTSFLVPTRPTGEPAGVVGLSGSGFRQSGTAYTSGSPII